MAPQTTPASPSLSEAVAICLRKYATFSGRASRREFWLFISTVFAVEVAGALALEASSGGTGGAALAAWLLLEALWFSTLIPSIAVSVRRLHDTGKTGWCHLLWLLGLPGFVVLLVFWSRPTEGPNRYGPPPGDPAQHVPPPPPAWISGSPSRT